MIADPTSLEDKQQISEKYDTENGNQQQQQDVGHGDAEKLEDQKRAHQRAMRKLDLRVVPSLLLLWWLNFLDRTNIGNAKISGLQKYIGTTSREFNTTLAIFYVGYIIAELPSNWVLKRVGPNIWLPFIIVVWGVITTLTGLVKNYSGLLAARFFLGFAEGGLLPGMVVYLSMLYPRYQLQVRIAYFYAGAAIAGAFGGILAYGLVHIDAGDLPKWGILTVVVGLGCMLILPRSVMKAKFLTAEEKDATISAMAYDCINQFHNPTTADPEVSAVPPSSRQATETEQKPRNLSENKVEKYQRVVQTYSHISETRTPSMNINDAVPSETFEWREVRRALLDAQVWLTGIGYLGFCCSLYSFSLFLPTILQGLHPNEAETQLQLLTVPPYVPAACMVIVIAYLADRLRWRGPFILMLLPIAMVGYVMLIASRNNRVRYGAVFLIALGIYPSAPCILSILPNNTAGHYKRATATALQLMVANCAGFLATFVYDSDRFGPDYVISHAIVLGCVALSWLCILLNVLYCRHENIARAEGKRAYLAQRYNSLVSQGKTSAPIGDRSPTFRFTI